MWKWEWICWFVNLISRDPQQRVRRYRRLIERLSREADIEGQWWRVFRDHPKRATPSAARLIAADVKPIDDERVAIVMQGPVVERDGLTLETLKLYQRTMPHCRLILSTWSETPAQQLDPIHALGVTVVTGEKPPHAGPHNLNLQITSTQRGLCEAKKRGCHYAMKTRTDTRIHLPDADRFCSDLLTQFPTNAASGQRERFVVVDFATRLYVPYHPSDLMMFGTTEDLLNYWSAELCGPEMTFQVCDDFDAMLRQSIPEVVLCRSFLNRAGVRLDDGLAAWWRILADRFIVIDREMIDLFWPKYNYNVDQRLTRVWDNGNMALCHFAQWMQLYSRSVTPAITLEDLRQQKVHAAIVTPHHNAAAA